DPADAAAEVERFAAADGPAQPVEGREKSRGVLAAGLEELFSVPAGVGVVVARDDRAKWIAPSELVPVPADSIPGHDLVASGSLAPLTRSARRFLPSASVRRASGRRARRRRCVTGRGRRRARPPVSASAGLVTGARFSRRRRN